MKIRRGGVWAVVLAIVAMPLLAAPAQAEEVVEPPAVEVIPDPPEWGYEWRDREYTVVCDGDNTTRIVIQSMWRPTEPEWDGEQWVTFDDWREWAWPEAVQTVYKPVEPGDCPTAEAPADGGSAEPAPEAVTPNTPEPHTELAVTGAPVLPLIGGGAVLATAGAALLWLGAARRRAGVGGA